ncbi:hypothetical protein CHH27_18095 [Labrenzia sp. VG12]|nr:hypothetical protein CHH27_18095 [Labrenzia sp. VG12]
MWRKLDDAHRDRDIPERLHALSQDWDEETASSLFWDCLCHQDTCYGATYASVPHLLQLAKRPPAPEAVASIACFLGHVSIVAFQAAGHGRSDAPGVLQGLPSDLEAWDRKLDPYRSLLEHAKKDLADPEFPENALKSVGNVLFELSSGPLQEGLDVVEPVTGQSAATTSELTLSREKRQAELDRYTDILSRSPVNEVDLKTIARIGDAFIEAQVEIADLCGKAYANAESPAERRYFLAGTVAAFGDHELAQLLESGDEGGFACGNCRWQYEYLMFGQRMAYYASPVGPGESDTITASEDLVLRDYQGGAPDRADGLVLPCEEVGTDTPAGRALQLVKAHKDPENEHRLRQFKGTFLCQKCSTQVPVTKIAKHNRS